MKNDDKLDTRIFIEHLIATFLIMLACWGLCIVLGVFDITTKTAFWVYIPWFIGGVSPAIASFVILKKNQAVNGFVLNINFGVICWPYFSR